MTSIWEFNARGCKLQDSLRFLTDEDIVYGSDTLGALIMGHKFKSWWTGTRLSIDQARRLAPGHNATTIQVAIGVTAAILWMIENPNMGVTDPDLMPHDQILKVANPYLGDVISQRIDWEPAPNTKWMLKDFLVDPAIEKTKAPENT
jgi:homospermidine synthase